MSNWQLNKLKSAVKTGTGVALNNSSNLIRSSNGETNFLNKLLLFYTQVSKLRKSFANSSSANIKISKTQMSKIVELGGVIFPFPSSNENSFIKATDEVLLLDYSYVKELAKRGFKKRWPCRRRTYFTWQKDQKRNFINYEFRNNSSK